MNGDLSEKLDRLLENPAMLAQIKTLADTMTAAGAGMPEAPPPSPQPAREEPPKRESAPLPALPMLSPAIESNLKNTRNLLTALKPLLDEKRCAKIDKMLSMMRLAEMAGQFGSFL